ncbi:CPBP family intramembrane glutamic endopeptidase [Microbacterium luticocti]|uniref:CPBP family intramembrane glutamic endopeptidase n=1 Tax=Microbacterium luticocti TaxID=451764 RepID=UPI00041CB28A|nr:CPBP family intramembrane glutamic endopeptidase [Microbacterium luticocti]
MSDEVRGRVAWPAVIVFVVAACALAWLIALPLWVSGQGLVSPWAGAVLPAMMLTPTVAMLIAVFALRTPRTDRLRFLGMWPLRPAGRFVGMLVVGLFGPIVVVGVTTLLAGAFGLVRLDLVGFSGFAEQLRAALPESTPLPPVGMLVAVQLAMIPFAALFNSVLAAGEELGWRGWLLPALRPLGTWPALVISGAIWGFWHTPIILLGYNFGRTDVTGVLFMIGGCIAWGVLLGWLRLRSASVWPAVLAHGSLNAVGGLVLMLRASGAPADLALVGPLGVVAWGVQAVVVVVLAVTGQFRRQPAPRPPKQPAAGTHALPGR